MRYRKLLNVLLLCSLTCFLFPAFAVGDDQQNFSALFSPQNQNAPSTVFGDPKGDVTLVEFMDYNCGYCKLMDKVIHELLQTDKHLRIVLVDFPMLAPSSTESALAVLAAEKDNHYLSLHHLLMNHEGSLTTEVLHQLIAADRLNVTTITARMQQRAITTALDKNINLGNDLGVMGLPAIFIGKTLKSAQQKIMPPLTTFGYMSLDDIRAAIATIRAS